MNELSAEELEWCRSPYMTHDPVAWRKLACELIQMTAQDLSVRARVMTDAEALEWFQSEGFADLASFCRMSADGVLSAARRVIRRRDKLRIY